MQIDQITLLAIGLVLLLAGGLLLAFYLYLRTAYKAGGWGRVRRDARIAALTLVAFAAIRIIENLGIQSLKRAVENWFK